MSVAELETLRSIVQKIVRDDYVDFRPHVRWWMVGSTLLGDKLTDEEWRYLEGFSTGPPAPSSGERP
jgi:hypothetical protein